MTNNEPKETPYVRIVNELDDHIRRLEKISKKVETLKTAVRELWELAAQSTEWSVGPTSVTQQRRKALVDKWRALGEGHVND